MAPEAGALGLLAAIVSFVAPSAAFLGAARGQFSAGGCTFEDGPGPCDYHQDPYDDFDWVHVSAQEPHYLPPEMPLDSSEEPAQWSDFKALDQDQRGSAMELKTKTIHPQPRKFT